MRTNLTEAQEDYAHFLPALSGFYATYVGKQRFEEYVPKDRIPSFWNSGIESLNYLNAKEGQFQYKWSLYSAGHADLDTTKVVPKEDMVRNRDRENTWLLGDSGGFQIGKGVWEGDWKDLNCPKAQAKRDGVLRWMDAYMDYGMILDIPAWVARSPKGAKATGISTYQDAVNATRINNDYWMKHRTGSCKFLNVLQGETHKDANDWYEQMKDYCDPVKYPDNHFNGWSMGGQNMCDVDLVLKRLVTLHFDNLLQEGYHDVMHFLGTSKLEWAVLLTDIQRAVRKYHNKNFMITYDCASPFLATANGQVYHTIRLDDRGKWSYMMGPSADDKKYSTDTRLFSDGVMADGVFENFEDSPISKHCSMKDICIYKPGDLNKIGKEGKTSWDSFSYALQMGHNVWMHIESTQRANEQYDAGLFPYMLINDKDFPGWGIVKFREVVDEIFSLQNREKSLQLIDKYSKYWMHVIGTRLNIGKKTVNASTMFGKLFEEL